MSLVFKNRVLTSPFASISTSRSLSTSIFIKCKSYSLFSPVLIESSPRAFPSSASSFKPRSSFISSSSRIMSAANPSLSPVSTSLAGHFDYTSGALDPVWVARDPWSKRPKFEAYKKEETETDVLVVGAGIAGISTAFELLQRGFSVILVDARQVLAGETGRTTGHLSTAVDSGYADLRKTFGDTQAKHVYDAHLFAVNHIEEVSQVLGIDCEFKRAKYLQMVHVNSDDPAYEKENDLPEEYDAAKALGIPVVLHKNMKLGAVYHGAVLEYPEETHARFHPTLYLNGLLKHMKEKYPHTFKCFTDTRVESFTPPSTGGLLSSLTGSSSKESKRVKADIEGGGSILAKHLIETTNIPARTLPIVAKESYDRTYAIGIKAPLGAFPDILLYNNDDPYIYVRKTSHPDKNYELVIVGGEDHAVGFHAEGMYNNLVEWTKKHYPEIGSDVEFKWSGQIICPNDGIAYIGESGGKEPNCYLVTGDYGNGLTYGVAASKVLTDIIEAKETGKDPKEVNPWVEVFDPSRKPKANTVVEMIKDNVIHQSKYLRWLTADGGVGDIEDIEPGCGAVYHGPASSAFKPIAAYKSPDGTVCKFSAVCPHMQGIVAWNDVEKSWDCPNHGSRFAGNTGASIMGPSVHGLTPQKKE